MFCTSDGGNGEVGGKDSGKDGGGGEIRGKVGGEVGGEVSGKVGGKVGGMVGCKDTGEIPVCILVHPMHCCRSSDCQEGNIELLGSIGWIMEASLSKD